MKTGILTFSNFLGREETGSSRIRGRWLVENWDPKFGECELFKFGKQYDCIVFQKAYQIELAKAFKGVKILDICDPDWMHWSYKVVEMIQEVDAITCSSFELAKAVTHFTDKPVAVIPDRIDLKSLPEPKKHVGEAKKVVWYGYSDNFPILNGATPVLRKMGLQLIVISNKVFTPPTSEKDLDLINLPWSSSWMTDIQKGDIVLNPTSKRGKWKYKSNNKTTLAWALGMPVAATDVELKALLSEQARITESENRLAEARRDYDIKLSVQELGEIIYDTKAKHS